MACAKKKKKKKGKKKGRKGKKKKKKKGKKKKRKEGIEIKKRNQEKFSLFMADGIEAPGCTADEPVSARALNNEPNVVY